jgi:uncharacterized protein (TIGR02646 family)
MKHVVKGTEPPKFTEWKSKVNANWKPDYANLQNPEKHLLHESLAQEQAWVCCYCGKEISLDDSHIEHFQSQKDHPGQALAYGNLHASCLREVKPGTPLHCGHAKGEKQACISPLEADCEQRFIYGWDGQIFPARKEDRQAIEMIELLNLNVAILEDQRKSMLSSIIDKDFLDEVSDAELEQLMRSYREKNEEGKLLSFGHVVARFIEQELTDRKDNP